MASETKELRVDIPIDLMRALDAIALTQDMERNKYIVAELEKLVGVTLHKANLLHQMLKGNPLLSESVGSGNAHNGRSVG